MAEVPRPSNQFCGSGSFVQASLAASLVALLSVLHSTVLPSVEAFSFDSGVLRSVCNLGVSGASAGRLSLPPPPPSFYHFSRSRGSSSSPRVSSSSRQRSVPSGSFGHNSCIPFIFNEGSHSPSLLELLEWCLKKKNQRGFLPLADFLSKG